MQLTLATEQVGKVGQQTIQLPMVLKERRMEPVQLRMVVVVVAELAAFLSHLFPVIFPTKVAARWSSRQQRMALFDA